MTLAAGPVWTFWIAVPLAFVALVSLFVIASGYVKLVSAQRYNPKSDGE